MPSAPQVKPAMFDAPEREAALPARIGTRYDVVSRLGRGGMAVVYRVRDRACGAEYALKQLRLPGSARDGEIRALFEREFHVLAQLEHPSAVQVHDFGVDAQGPFYTMELLDDGDLTTRAPWPHGEVCQLLMQVCSLLSLLHARGFVHRDITPRNIRLTARGTAKLIDFGAMVPMGAGNAAVGTPGFVAPEVVHQLAVDARTDLFSLGATLYYALTGQRPSAARTLAELSEAWRTEPTPPSRLTADVPATLDALSAALLQIDPARRPHSAFEVMQRLAAVSGRPIIEAEEIASAYLATPMLVGRDQAQRQFRKALQRADAGHSGSVLLSGVSGAGRSRLLEACVLEAKTQGATVLRVEGRAARPESFACAQRLMAQLLEAFPDEAAPASANEPSSLHALWQDWVERLARAQPLVIALDDAERIDRASLGLLLTLLNRNGAARLLLVCAVQSPLDPEAQPALAALERTATQVALDPLTGEETGKLLTSIFAGAQRVALVSDRVHRLAAGNPRATLALAHYLVDRQLIRYVDGGWVLPAELALSQLPASTEDALLAQIAALPELARRLLETQALALEGPWTVADYRALAPDAEAQLEPTLQLLVRSGLLVRSAGHYTLSHHGVRSHLTLQLTAAERIELERTLAEFCARTGRSSFVEAYHLLHGERFEAGLDRLWHALEPITVMSEAHQQLGVEPQLIAATLERAYSISVQRGRRAWERFELARRLTALSLLTEEALYYRYAPTLQRQLEQDSGLDAYRRTDPTLSAGERLQQALVSTAAHYESLPDSERVYRVDQAIRHLSIYVTVRGGIAGRTLDAALIGSTAELLAPFASLSPALHALWQSAVCRAEIHCQARIEQARVRTIELYRRLSSVTVQEFPAVEAMRDSMAMTVAALEVLLGYETAEHWIELSGTHPTRRRAALGLRRALATFDGDQAMAARLQTETELLAAQLSSPQMIGREPLFELHQLARQNDLSGVSRVVSHIAQLATRWPGWRPVHEYAQGVFHRMRGDFSAARSAFERALAATDPDALGPLALLPVWLNAAEGCIAVMGELGQLEAAHRLGLAVDARRLALETTGYPGFVRELAVVEAKLGLHAQAAARLDAQVAAHEGRRRWRRALDFEARARVAILARDAAAASDFSERVYELSAADSSGATLARHARLVDEARSVGLTLEGSRSAFEAALLERPQQPSVSNAHRAELTTALAAQPDAAARAQRTLEWLAAALSAQRAQLYRLESSELVRCATLGSAELALDETVQRYWQQRRQHTAMTTVFTEKPGTAALSAGYWTSPDGTTYCLLPLSPGGEAECVGLTALASESTQIANEYWTLSAALCQLLQTFGDLPDARSGPEPHGSSASSNWF